MRITPALLAAALLAASPALAQTQTPLDKTQAAPAAPASDHAPTTNPPARSDKYHAMLDQRIGSMHQRLHITTAQDAAWNDFAQVMRDNANSIEQAYQKRADALGTMTAAENLKDYAQLQQDRAQDLQKLSTSFDTLYGQLSEQQKKTADAMFRQYDVQRTQAHQAAAHGKTP